MKVMKTMKILITAGGTSEKIDEVRKITNTATGQLGSLIAEEFIKKTQAEITYVCGENAVTPMTANMNITNMNTAKIIKIGSVEDLENTLTKLFAQTKFDAVIHSMAVSDYSVQSVISVDELSSVIADIDIAEITKKFINNHENMADIIKSALLQNIGSVAEKSKKISSNFDNLIIFMNKTPKVISMIKRMQPETILVGFKLLAGVSEEELLHTGHKLLIKNNCDFVIANDSENISKDRHEAILIERDFSFSRLSSKQKIAEAIADKVIANIK